MDRRREAGMKCGLESGIWCGRAAATEGASAHSAADRLSEGEECGRGGSETESARAEAGTEGWFGAVGTGDVLGEGA